MNRERAAALLPIIKAFAEGKEVQHYIGPEIRWETGSDFAFDQDPSTYRVKPEPKLRPWKPEECPKYFMAREHKHSPVKAYRASQDNNGCPCVRDFTGSPQYLQFVLATLIRVHEDGTESPCGVLE